MMCRALTAYNAVLGGMLSGKSVVSVEFDGQKVVYESNSASQKNLLALIARLHQSCGNASSAALLGLGGGGPIGTTFGARSCW